MMKCQEARSQFTPYLDGAGVSAEMRMMHEHLEQCAECRTELRRLQRTQQLVAGLGRKPAPPELALRLQVALSQASRQSLQSRWESLQVRWSNTLNAFMLPATAGVISAVLFFGLIIGYIAVPVPVEASSDVVPMLYTPPQLSSSPFLATIGRIDGSLVVETYVDANGRVQDYRIISAPEGTEKMIPQLDNMLIFTTFRPALNLGRPTASRVVLSFSGVDVKG